ncbi:uncharacterized protein LOC122043717 [Zingiber officinale]|uniref:uncharacterized protein LOC122043717 n=1 Tax=Zingiber officinale TaxID=94328 RepID=UPI001C4C051E|nr:uncharacterized protein LOC122043717 [Zingiber officinale]
MVHHLIRIQGVGKRSNKSTSQDPERWNLEDMKKAQIDSKTLNTLQCGLTKEELNYVSLHENVKELWDKLVELHESTTNSKDGEITSQLHARIRNIMNGLHLIGHRRENHDLIRIT